MNISCTLRHMKNGYLAIWTISILFILSHTACSDKTVADKVMPNVLFIGIDDLRPELGCYGASHIKSPHIDALAAQSTLFENAYCNVPVCGASRASLLTGLRPTLTRFKRYFTRADEDAPDATTLPGLFKANGYTTVSNGKIFHDRDDSYEDWDEIWRPTGDSPRDYLDPVNVGLDTMADSRGAPYEHVNVQKDAYRDGKMTEKSIDDLKTLSQSEKPFFLAVGYQKPHLPFNAPKKYWDWYDSTDIQLPANKDRPTDVPVQALHTFGELRHYHGIPKKGPVSDDMAHKLIHGYYASVSYIDELIGDLTQALTDLGLAKNTIVVLWGDHGWNLYEHGLWCKHCNYRTSLQVPLIIKIPDHIKPVQRSEMVEYVDIYPTLVDLCGLPDPGHLEGNSLVPLLGNQSVPTWKKQVESVWKNGFTYTSKEYAYTEWRSDTDTIEAQMLFDHIVDPQENKNLMQQENAAEIVEEMKGAWD